MYPDLDVFDPVVAGSDMKFLASYARDRFVFGNHSRETEQHVRDHRAQRGFAREKALAYEFIDERRCFIIAQRQLPRCDVLSERNFDTRTVLGVIRAIDRGHDSRLTRSIGCAMLRGATSQVEFLKQSFRVRLSK